MNASSDVWLLIVSVYGWCGAPVFEFHVVDSKDRLMVSFEQCKAEGQFRRTLHQKARLVRAECAPMDMTTLLEDAEEEAEAAEASDARN